MIFIARRGSFERQCVAGSLAETTKLVTISVPQFYNRRNYNFRIGKYSKWKPARTRNTDRVSDLDHIKVRRWRLRVLNKAWSDFKLDRVIFGDNKWEEISNRVPRNISPRGSDLIRVTVGDVVRGTAPGARFRSEILESIQPSLENFRWKKSPITDWS